MNPAPLNAAQAHSRGSGRLFTTCDIFMLSYIGWTRDKSPGRRRKVCDGIMPARVITLLGYYLGFTTLVALPASWRRFSCGYVGFHVCVCDDNAEVKSDLPMQSRAEKQI